MLIAVVFTWFQDPAELRKEVGGTWVVVAVQYLVPVVLFAVLAIRLTSSVRIPAWGLGVGSLLLGRLAAAGITLGGLAVLLVLGVLLLRVLPVRIRRRVGRLR